MDKVENEAKPQEAKVDEVTTAAVSEVMERQENNKCCHLSNDIKTTCHLCVRSWSLLLNLCEGSCSALSTCCIFASSLAIGCNKCLEQMDCDGH